VRRSLRAASLLGLIAILLVGGVVYARAAFCPDLAWHAGVTDASLLHQVTSSEELRASKDKDKAHPNVYGWTAVRGESGLKLRGAVPSEDDRRTMLGMVKANFPDLKVEDNLKIVEGGPPRELWLGAVSFGLAQLAHLKKGVVRLSDANLKVVGEAGSPEDYAQIKKALAGPLPTGLTIKGDDVRPPVVDPFIFTADLGVNALSLAGSVPSEDARKQVRDLSRQLFARPGLDDRLEVASGAPKNWDEAVTAALHALSKLETGKVALSGLAVTIEGVAPDQGTAVAVSYQLRRDLPKLFSTSESIKWKEASAARDAAATVLPRIKAYARTTGAWPKGELPPLSPVSESE
jgi:hypothetical protein